MSEKWLKRGIGLALVTAMISGFSIYYNSFGAKAVGEPFVFTTLKNTIVALLLTAVVMGSGKLQVLKSLNKSQWIKLLSIGVIGGSIPFLLFFYGITIATPAAAAVIHKTLFLWVALLAVPFLKEKLGLWPILGVVALGSGIYLFESASINKFFSAANANGFKSGEVYILIATLMWAVETVIAKKVLSEIPAEIGAWSRMFFGMVLMWGYLFVTGKVGAIRTFDVVQWQWIVLTSVFLFGYVWSWYSALKAAPAVVVTSVLTIGAVITVALSVGLDGRVLASKEAWGGLLMLVGVVAVLSQLRVGRLQRPSEQN